MLRLTSAIDYQPLTNPWTTFANHWSRSTCGPPVVQGPNHDEENIGEQHGVWKITEKISFNIGSEAFTLKLPKTAACSQTVLPDRSSFLKKVKSLRKMPKFKGDNFRDFQTT